MLCFINLHDVSMLPMGYFNPLCLVCVDIMTDPETQALGVLQQKHQRHLLTS